MAINPPLNAFNEHADRWLREHRPDRYDPSNAEWLDTGAEALGTLLPEAEVRAVAARELIGRRETQATRRANKIIREYADDSQMQMQHWWDTENEPLAIKRTISDDEGTQHTINERVTLRAVTSNDLRAFAHNERERAEKDHKVRLRTCDGAELLASDLERSGQTRLDEWLGGAA